MRPTAAALLIAVGLLSVPAAAQVQSPSPGLSDQSPDISDQKLDAVPGFELLGRHRTTKAAAAVAALGLYD
jgi:hypothetical protein